MTVTVNEGPGRRPTYPATGVKTHVGTAGGFSVAALVGAGVVVLALIAAGGFWPKLFSSIAVIGVGGMLLAESLGVAVRYRRSMHTNDEGRFIGLSATGIEVIGGATAVTLGILALVGVAPITLLDIACIAFGGALALGSGAAMRFGASADYDVENAISAYAAARPIAGIGAVLLGIVGLMDLGRAHEMLFTEISLLAVGAAAFLGGFALAGGHAHAADRLEGTVH